MHLINQVFHYENTNMKKLFTLFSLILLLIAGVEQAFGQNRITYPAKLDIEFVDFLRADLKFSHNTCEPFTTVLQTSKLQLAHNQDAENREWTGSKPILTLGSIPDILLKYQSGTLLQWGYTLRDRVLSLRIGARAEDSGHIDFKGGREKNDIINFRINFDFWFK
jgi:hypothetical protein